MRIQDSTIDKWISEDVPYFDLTTHLLGFGAERGRLAFYSREETVACGTEEVARIFARIGGIDVGAMVPSGTDLMPGALLIEGFGSAEALHSAWKVSVNVLEYSCGIAARTRELREKARAVNPDMEIVSTRKGLPGTKELATKAVLAGGGLPHRLGLSETILVFDHHRTFLDRPLRELLPELRRRACEKKVIVESENQEDALELLRAGADGVQFDKVPPEILAEHISRIRGEFPGALIIAAGGVNAKNIAAYAAAKPDAAATSSMYFGKPADIRATMEKREGEKA